MKDYYFSITARVCSSIAQVHLSYFFLSYPRVLYHIGMEALDNNFNITYATLIFSPPQAENFRSSYLLNADFLSKKHSLSQIHTVSTLGNGVFLLRKCYKRYSNSKKISACGGPKIRVP